MKFHVQGRRKHFGGELLAILTGNLFRFAKRVMFREVAEHLFVAGKSEADASSNQSMRFASLIFGDDAEGDLAVLEVLEAFAARN